MKTKTLVETLTFFRVIPADAEDPSDLGSDLIPEAILVKNILEEMVSSLKTIVLIKDFCLDENEGINEQSCLEDTEIGEKVSTLRVLLKKWQLQQYEKQQNETRALRHQKSVVRFEQDISYDADSEFNGTASIIRSESSKKKNLIKKKAKSSSKSSLGRHNDNASSLGDEIANACRNVLLVAQNQRRAAVALKEMLNGRTIHDESPIHDFLHVLGEMHDFSKVSVTTPLKNRAQEVADSCLSADLRQRFDKICTKLRDHLAEAERERSESLAQLSQERSSIEEELERVREESLARIIQHSTEVSDRARVTAWNSHARRTKTHEHLAELRRELEESTTEHVQAETEMRKACLKLEEEVDDMIKRYDAQMFQRHESLTRLRREYAAESEELQTLLAELAEVEGEKDALEGENRLVEEKKRREELDKIRRIVAAKTIQRIWRAYKTRMLLKSKKRRRKRTKHN